MLKTSGIPERIQIGNQKNVWQWLDALYKTE